MKKLNFSYQIEFWLVGPVLHGCVDKCVDSKTHVLNISIKNILLLTKKNRRFKEDQKNLLWLIYKRINDGDESMKEKEGEGEGER